MSKIVEKKSENLKVSQTISKKLLKKKKKLPEKNAILLVFNYQEDAIRPELFISSRFRIQGGYTERDGVGVVVVVGVVAGRRFPFLIQD